MLMTREEGVNIITRVMNSGIISDELATALGELATCICNDDFAECVGTEYCKDCQFKAQHSK